MGKLAGICSQISNSGILMQIDKRLFPQHYQSLRAEQYFLHKTFMNTGVCRAKFEDQELSSRLSVLLISTMAGSSLRALAFRTMGMVNRIVAKTFEISLQIGFNNGTNWQTA